MNLYFLVEGRHTERRLYPRWLGHTMPHFVRVQNADEVTKNSYYLFSGEGWPRLLDSALPRAIQEINAVGTYDYLILCLDAEEASIEQRNKEAEAALGPSTSVRVIVQNRCVETWLLGNRRMFPRNPTSKDLRGYIDFYNVRENDPEVMGTITGFPTHASFHLAYLQAIFDERNEPYGKYHIGHAGDQPYLNELIARTEDLPGDLTSFRVFLDLIRKIVQMTLRDGPDRLVR